MVDLDKLNAAGITPERLKEFFAPKAGLGDAAKAVMNRVRSRIQDGRTRNYQEYHVYHAVDRLIETPFRQASLALIQSLADSKDEKATDKIAQDWGLTHLLSDQRDPKTGKPTGKKVVNVPSLIEIALPLASALSTIRAARLTNDRVQVPLLKYSPHFSTPMNRRRCELITSMVELDAYSFGYRNTLRQTIKKTCDYGAQLLFIKEEWWHDKQPGKDNGAREIIREGLRFHLPHPALTYCDQEYPTASLNNDTGSRFCGYWGLTSFNSLAADPLLWNKDVIKAGASDWRSGHPGFYSSILNGCTLSPPYGTPAYTTLVKELTGANQQPYFTSTIGDNGLFLNQHFEKLNPKSDGIGDYDGWVWFRFVVANDDTPLWVAPLPGPPATYWGYDSDDSRSLNPSVVQQGAPYEFWISNLLTQFLLSVKQNLSNLTFYNEDFVTQDHIKQVESYGEKYYRKLNFAPMSGKYLQRLRSGSGSIQDAFYSAQFPRHDVNGIPPAINMVLNLMERMLGISAQESGAQGTHQQSAEEMRVLSQSSGSRLQYTGLGIDDGVAAWKKQLYAYRMAYGSSKAVGYISAEGTSKEELVKLGFTVDEEGGEKFKVNIEKTALELDHFVSVRDGIDRPNDAQTAQQMIQLLAPFAPRLAQAMQPEDIAKLFNGVLEQFGLPRDWRIKGDLSKQGPLASEEWVVQQITGLAKQVQEGMQNNSEAMMQNVLGATKRLAGEIGQIGQGMGQVMQVHEAQGVQISNLTKILTAAQAIANQHGTEPLNTGGIPGGGFPPTPLAVQPAADSGLGFPDQGMAAPA